MLDLREFEGDGVDHGWLGPHTTPGRYVTGVQFSDGQGKEVGRYGHRLVKFVNLAPPVVGIFNGDGRVDILGQGGHDGGGPGRDGYAGIVRHLHRRAVLAGEQAPGANGHDIANSRSTH